MSTDELLHKLGVLLGASMIISGAILGIWLLSRFPPMPAFLTAPAQAAQPAFSPIGHAAAASPLTATNSPLKTDVETAAPLITGVASGLPPQLTEALSSRGVLTATLSGAETDGDASLILSYAQTNGIPVYRQTFAVANRFQTVNASIRWQHVQAAWQGVSSRYRLVAILAETRDALEATLGPAGPNVREYAAIDEIVEALAGDPFSLTFVPFERLTPQLVVVDIDGQNPVENNARFDDDAYPFAATVYARPGPAPAPAAALDELLNALPDGNRDPERLTVVAMTGVTAMVRYTAAQMDQRGTAWPAEVIGPELAQADITAISNEVPFVEDCETDLDPDNLVFCSKPEYLEALLATGVDIVGLTGNHINDYGTAGARDALDLYAEAGLPVYGGGADLAAARAPLLVEHNGNRLAFLGANSYGPPSAWATEFSPGSAPFDLSVMSATIRNLKTEGEADVVFAELQYQESYYAEPLADQRLDFRALVRAGADIVTGVQSHVPQAAEFLDGNLILYGLGNLYFDQMWREDTRQGLIAKHTIYEGRHLSTQLLPTILYDYGQPRWASPTEHAAILEKVFAAGQ